MYRQPGQLTGESQKSIEKLSSGIDAAMALRGHSREAQGVGEDMKRKQEAEQEQKEFARE